MGRVKSVSKNIFMDWIVPLGVAVLIVGLLTKFVFFNVNVVSGSMRPTLEVGDRAFVTRVHKPSKLKTGDIVVFNVEGKEEPFIKRLIGVPGDSVRIKGNDVYVNGKKLESEYVKFRYSSEYNYDRTFEVPDGEYFFLGDNRPNSNDSRMWSYPYIKEDKIIGKARFIIFPFNKLGSLK